MGAGGLVLVLAIAWNFVEPGRKNVTAPPVTVDRLPPKDEHPRITEAPGVETPPPSVVPSTLEPARPAGRKSEPDEGDVPARKAVQKAAPIVIAPERDRPERAEPGPPREPAPKVARAGDVVEKQVPPATRPGDLRQLLPIVGTFRPANPGAEPPRMGFWPMARPDDMTAWQVGDPDRIGMDRDGVSLSAGPGGNLLLTKRESYRRCTLSMTVSAKKGTEAFLALRAHRGPDGWTAITARVYDDEGRIRAGYQSTDFQPSERGTRPETVAIDKSFRIKFQIDGQDVAGLIVNQTTTSSITYAKTPAADYRGAVGVFVKSGTLVIHAMDVQE
jgi:hypothetical protein